MKMFMEQTASKHGVTIKEEKGVHKAKIKEGDEADHHGE
jgi:hypothetical protein